MLTFGKYGNLIFDGQALKPNDVPNMEEFMVANLGMIVSFEEGLTLEELLNFFSPMRGFIYQYFSEPYDKLKALITGRQVSRKYVHLKIFKKLTVEDSILYFQPVLDFVVAKDSSEHGPSFLSELPVIIERDVAVIEENLKNEITGEFKTGLSLQDVTIAIFDDLVEALTSGFVQ